MSCAQAVPLRYLARIDPGKSEVKHLPDDLEVDFVPMEVVGHGGRLHPSETRPLGEVRAGYTYLRSGDVSFAKISPSFQNRKGGRAEGLTNGLAFATTELTILRPEPTADARFLQYVVESEPFIQHGAATLHGVAGQQRVDLSRVAAFPVWSPGLDTQRRIADMLDAETARIDTLIEKNEWVLELLDKRETSLITRAVTGESGLGSDVHPFPMVALRYLTRGIQAGVDFASSDLSMDAADGLVRYVRTTDIASIDKLSDEAVYAPVQEVPDSAMARDGDLLVTRAGSLGTAYVHRGAPVAVAGYLVRIEFDGSSEPDFYGYWCRSRPFLDALEVGATQTTIQNFSASKYASMPTPAPPLDTQRSVVRLLDAEMSKLDALRSAVARQQELLRLRRQALITAAVTGEIEV